MKDLSQLRQEINEIDAQLLELLAKRVSVVKEVGEYKKENNLPIVDPEREQQIIDDKIKKAEKLNLSSTFIQKIWRTIFDEAYELEK